MRDFQIKNITVFPGTDMVWFLQDSNQTGNDSALHIENWPVYSERAKPTTVHHFLDLRLKNWTTLGMLGYCLLNF